MFITRNVKGQMTPHQKGGSPDKTQMGKIAGVASGAVGSKGPSPKMPKGQLDKHC